MCKILYITLLIIAGCSTPFTLSIDKYDRIRSEGRVAFVALATPNIVIPPKPTLPDPVVNVPTPNKCNQCHTDKSEKNSPSSHNIVLPKRIIYFGAKWCASCGLVKLEFEKMKLTGWKIGTTSDNQIQVVDVDTDEAFTKLLGVSAIPVFILMEDGKEVRRHEGFLNAFQILDFWNGVL